MLGAEIGMGVAGKESRLFLADTSAVLPLTWPDLGFEEWRAMPRILFWRV